MDVVDFVIDEIELVKLVGTVVDVGCVKVAYFEVETGLAVVEVVALLNRSLFIELTTKETEIDVAEGLIDETTIDEMDVVVVFVGITEETNNEGELLDVATDVAVDGIVEDILVAIILFDCEINVVIEEIAVKAIDEKTDVAIAEEITIDDVELTDDEPVVFVEDEEIKLVEIFDEINESEVEVAIGEIDNEINVVGVELFDAELIGEVGIEEKINVAEVVIVGIDE